MTVGIDQGGIALTYNPAYPIIGVNQSSQQFRDNFLIIKNAVENLQSKTITFSGILSGSSPIFDSGTGTINANISFTNGVISLPSGNPSPVAGMFRFNTGSGHPEIYNTAWHTVLIDSDVSSTVSSFNSRTGVVTLNSTDVTTALGFAPYSASNPNNYITASSPNLTGTPTSPTATAGTNTTQIATTAFVTTAVSSITAGVSSFNSRMGAITLTSSDVTTALSFTPVNNSIVGANNGLATLNSSGQLTSSQIPASILGAVVYQGVWNATTNSPTLTSSTGTKGNYYKVSVTGSTTLDGINSWNIGDVAIFNGTMWDKIDGIASEVLTVAGRTGVITLTVSDVSGAAPLSSPNLTGTPTSPTATAGTNTTQIATTAFVTTAINALTTGVSSFNSRTGAITLTSSDVTTALTYTPYNSTNPSGYITAASPALTGTPTAPTATAGTNTTQIATTAFVTSAVAASTAGVSSFNSRTGAITLTSSDVTTALTYTPYNSTNPSGYITGASPTFTGSITIGTANFGSPQTFTIVNNQLSAATIFSYTAASYNLVIVEYSLVKESSTDYGVIYIANNGTTPDFTQSGGSIGSGTGVTFSVTQSSGTTNLQYVSTNGAGSGTFTYMIRKF